MTANRDIYIVLTGTGTAFSGIIKWFTKAELNHASIAFDSELREVYSFGRKKCTTRSSPDLFMRTSFTRSTAVQTVPSTSSESVKTNIIPCIIMSRA